MSPITNAAVRDLLHRAACTVRNGWSRNHLAEDASGEPVPTSSKLAVRYCATGAMWFWYVAMGRPPRVLEEARAALRRTLPFGLDISTWNATAKDAAQVADAIMAAAKKRRDEQEGA